MVQSCVYNWRQGLDVCMFKGHPLGIFGFLGHDTNMKRWVALHNKSTRSHVLVLDQTCGDEVAFLSCQASGEVMKEPFETRVSWDGSPDFDSSVGTSMQIVTHRLDVWTIMLVYPGSSLDLYHHTTKEMKDFFHNKKWTSCERRNIFSTNLEELLCSSSD